MSKYHKCRWIATAPDGVSITNMEEIKVTIGRDNKGREKKFVATAPTAVTITVNTTANTEHPSGIILQYGEFLIQLTEYNKEWLIRKLKAEWVVMDDEDVENELLDIDAIEDATFIEVEPEPVMVEEALREPKSKKSQKRMDNLKGEKETTKG